MQYNTYQFIYNVTPLLNKRLWYNLFLKQHTFCTGFKLEFCPMIPFIKFLTIVCSTSAPLTFILTKGYCQKLFYRKTKTLSHDDVKVKSDSWVCQTFLPDQFLLLDLQHKMSGMLIQGPIRRKLNSCVVVIH